MTKATPSPNNPFESVMSVEYGAVEGGGGG